MVADDAAGVIEQTVEDGHVLIVEIVVDAAGIAKQIIQATTWT